MYDFLYIYKRVHYVILYASHVGDYLWSGCIDNTCGLDVVLFRGCMKKIYCFVDCAVSV